MPQVTYRAPVSYTPSPIEVMTQSTIANYEGSQALPAQHQGAALQAQEYVASVSSPAFTYTQKLTSYFTPTPQQQHVPDNFLQLYRPQTQFIDSAQEIEDIIKETFEKTTNNPLPSNIIIRILDKEDMQRIHDTNASTWNDNIQGFSINGKQKQVFVKKGDLDRVMLVLGHEIGHVLTPRAETSHDEEAKAFAFEMAWMKTIVTHNIANLKNNINLKFKPANNGLHNVAFSFVKEILAQGREALEIYWDITRKKVKVAA